MQQAGLKVVWVCDPCHGNTVTTKGGYKTRDFDLVLSEITQSFEVHRMLSSHLAGVYIELTGENVTECVGGPGNMMEEDPPHCYTTYCDPRMNYSQSMEMSFLLAEMIQKARGPRTPRFRAPTADQEKPQEGQAQERANAASAKRPRTDGPA